MTWDVNRSVCANCNINSLIVNTEKGPRDKSREDSAQCEEAIQRLDS